jgi:hypothetical protein
MSKELQKMLQELQNRGNTILGDEVAAFLEATEEKNPNTAIPYAKARMMLAQAAKTLRDGRTREDISIAHDFPDAVTAALGKELAHENAFKNIEKVQEEGSDADFKDASEELVTSLASLLLDGGYVDEARRYLTEYNVMKEERNSNVATKSTTKTLKDLQAQYRKNGDLVRARALEEVISDLDEEESKEKEADSDAKKLEEMDAPVPQAPAKAEEDECEDESKGAEEKPVLPVEPPSDEECKEKEEASAALSKGNIKKAKSHLAKAAKMERIRLTAALIKIGDMELAMAGLDDAEEDAIPAEEKAGGYAAPKEEEKKDDEAADKAKDKEAEGCDVSHNADEKPTKDETDKRDADAKEAESSEPMTPYKDVADEEKLLAQGIVSHVKKSIKAGKLADAKEALKDLNKLEQAIVAGVKKAEIELKDAALAKEGYGVWKEVRAMNLKAIKLVADIEGDDETSDKAADGLEKLDSAIPEAPKDEEEAPKGDDLGDSLDSEPSEEDQPKDDEEADAMKYECLQSIADLKNLNVGRDSLAFTFWESKEDPFWTIQASGKPIAEVHLVDQTDPEDVAAFFCDQSRWPNVIAQTTEKVGLYTMLTGVKARFYAHGVTKSALASTLKTEVEASVKEMRAERLGTLRNDFVDAMVCAAEALNKGLIAGKANPLKRAFVDKLASLGFSNPALVVEECFASSFKPYLDQVVADASEYLEMPKEAFAYTRKMIESSSNVAVAQASQFSDETLGQRLSRRSMPLAPSAEAFEAPNEVEASLKSMSSAEKHADMKRRLRLGMKY